MQNDCVGEKSLVSAENEVCDPEFVDLNLRCSDTKQECVYPVFSNTLV